MNKNNLLNELEYTAIAYKNIQPESDKSRLITINDERTDIQCYIRTNRKETNITFRGTSSIRDWLTDLRFWKKKIPYNEVSPNIKVHSGFIDAYKSKNVRLKIHEIVKENVCKIKVSGHSYGAGLAVLCAIDLEYNFPNRDYEVYLFGCPRVGNKAFKDSYDKRIFKTFRVYNGNDIVTKIPFALFGYRHVGIGIHVGDPRVFGIWSFKDHNPQDYYRGILDSII